jgi:hypothetical protein
MFITFERNIPPMPAYLKILKLASISALMAINSVFGQDKPSGIKVYSENRQQFAFPWAGGMNSCQFGKLDINLDGIKDLVVFDRTGDRIMPFLAVPSGETFDYQYAPEYTDYFPKLTQWAIFTDYDGDGKEDIFTYSPGYAGMKVYRNVSQDHLEFRLVVYPYLKTFQGGGYVNILVTNADYPGIYDIDGDGDLDVLTFYGLGSFVEMHRNMSVEKYGNRDSLDFMQVNYCWGHFAESEESNVITLDTCLRCESMEAWGHGGMEEWKRGSGEAGNGQRPTANGQLRHTGSTFCLLDLNGDQLIDLVLGDVDYPNLVALYNGGTVDTARMVSYVWEYPESGPAVNLFSMPAAFYGDLDFDGVKDMLVSPFDPNPFLTSNFESTLLYHNDGGNDQPQLHLVTKSFLQDRMIDVGSGAYPVFCDIDQDGLEDLVIGNYGYYDSSYYDQYMILHTVQTSKIAYLRNTGTAGHPAFAIIDRDFAGASALNKKGLVPTFGDIDGDNDIDMLLGCEDGTIISYINTAGPGVPLNLVLSQLNYQGIDVGAFSAPQLFDFDRDNLPDLVIGEKGGNLNYYHNSGTLQNPVFALATDSLGKVNVTDHSVSLDGYSVPFLFRDAQDRTQLLVGSEQGEIFYFTGVDEAGSTGAFQPSDTLGGLIGIENFVPDRGYRTAAALYDLYQDGKPELFAGNFSGGLEYFASTQVPPVSGIYEINGSNPGINVFPVPATHEINIALGDPGKWRIFDIKIYSTDGRLLHSYKVNNEIKTKINTDFLVKGVFILKISLKQMETGEVQVFQSKFVTIF